MSDNLERDRIIGQLLSAGTYLVLWGLIWFAITLTTQMPTDLQLAHAYSLGSTVSDCVADPGRHPVPFPYAFRSYIDPDVQWDQCAVIFLAPIAVLIQLGLSGFGNWFVKQNNSRFGLSVRKNFNFLLRKGIVLGIAEALFLGGFFGFFANMFTNFSLAGDDCAYTWVDASNINIQFAGAVISYFAACVIASCIAFPSTNPIKDELNVK
jgi:hypothetical protein